ncbi:MULTISPECIES: sugar-phosphatase [unclassified Fusibacter]|uniref:sugar-phosphatase n=1 Tax=unclassified Fusibacter TaxID=2624464 RepID=UPI0010115B0D|nr:MULTISPECIES: sugar-phosphatase [unclassified Fusibacter]MCK8059171.1 sugar-phosphatase [Fusibacter sp. A2]NPE22580.1 sugar-phosphatase [Fusibacter sp. A1]RXV60681.1 sugar-phosphatase [Fusibacter sp. A1]
MYQLIALDMDGTLLNEDKNISKMTLDAIEALKAIGKKVVLATGRPLHGIKRYIDELDLLDEHDYVVTYNGALVQSTKGDHVLLDVPLDLDAFKELFALSQELGVHIHALTENSVITPKNNAYTEIESQINQIPIIEMPVGEVSENTLIVKVMFVDKPEILEDAISRLPQWVKDKYTVVRSAPFFLEFLDPRVNKGAGVHAIATKLGLKQSQVICVGDQGNDLAMIEYAQLGVAMKNATDDLKAAADYVTLSNEEDGVAHVIRKFML